MNSIDPAVFAWVLFGCAMIGIAIVVAFTISDSFPFAVLLVSVGAAAILGGIFVSYNSKSSEEEVSSDTETTQSVEANPTSEPTGDTSLNGDVNFVEKKYRILIEEDSKESFPEVGRAAQVSFIVVDPVTKVISGPIEGQLFNDNGTDFILTVTDASGTPVEYSSDVALASR